MKCFLIISCLAISTLSLVSCNRPPRNFFLLLNSARSNVRYTTATIKQGLQTVTDKEVLSALNQCLQAYERIGTSLDIDPSSLGTPSGRSQACRTMYETEDDLTADCELSELGNNLMPVVLRSRDEVRSFSDDLKQAWAILQSMGI